MDLKRLTMETFANGAAIEMFDRELRDVLNNIDDINTKSEVKREVTLKFTIQPNAERDQARLFVEAKSKLAPIRDVGGNAYFGRDNGQMVAFSQDVNQMELNLKTPPQEVSDPEAAAQPPQKDPQLESTGSPF